MSFIFIFQDQVFVQSSYYKLDLNTRPKNYGLLVEEDSADLSYFFSLVFLTCFDQLLPRRIPEHGSSVFLWAAAVTNGS